MKTFTRNTLSLAALTALFGLAGTQAQAQLNLTYSIGGVPTVTASSDTLDIAGYTGSATLVSGVAQSLKIGSATFTATSSNNNIFYNQDISRNLTLNGVTALLPEVAAFQSLAAFSPFPGLTIPGQNGAIVADSGAAPTTYTFADGSTVMVTTDQAGNPDVNAATSFTQTFDVTASFLYTAAPAGSAVPEPGSVALLVGMATVGTGVLRKRRK